MGQTPVHGLPWPDYTDPARIPTDIEALAAATEDAIETIAADRVVTTGDVMTGSLGFQLAAAAVHNVHAAATRVNSTVTGYMLIRLPGPTGKSAMLQLAVRGYDFADRAGQWRLDLGGYANSTSGWVFAKQSARAEGWFPGGKRTLPVAFLTRGSAGAREFAIAIGESSTSWSYPSAVVEAIAGYSGADLVTQPGWSVAFVADITDWQTAETLTAQTPYVPVAGALRQLAMSASQAIPTGVNTDIANWVALAGDTGNGVLTLASGRTITAAEAGYYDIGFSIRWDNANTAGVRLASIRVDGAGKFRDYRDSAGFDDVTITMPAVYLAAGQTVVASVQQTTGATISASLGLLTMRKVADAA